MKRRSKLFHQITFGMSAAAWKTGVAKDDAVALARGGHAIANFVGDVDKGLALIEKALMLNPNLAAGWFLCGFVRIMQGDLDGAIASLTRCV